MGTERLWLPALILAVYCSSLINSAPIKSEPAATSDATEGDEMTWLENNSAEETTGEGNIIFEGDIEISLEEIRKYYDIDETAERELEQLAPSQGETHVDKRAARNEREKMWINKTVPYVISSTFTSPQREKIIGAINIWSQETCLTFVPRTSEGGYINFIKSSSSCSSSVGRTGRRQYIRLTSGCARSTGIILHEIGHALGLWHEQSRPDRDSYVRVYYENIRESKEHNFQRKKDLIIDYQGTRYDYGSVMHYRQRAFVKSDCPGCLTLNVSNNTEYERQGRPTVGQRRGLSPSDITQINRLYNCPAPGEIGLLAVFIQDGKITEDTSSTSTSSVEVRALNSSGGEYVKDTSPVVGRGSTTWNQWLIFPNEEWQLFRLRSKNDGDFTGMSLTVPLLNRSRNSTHNRYCTNTNCDGHVSFDYKILPPKNGFLKVNILNATISREADVYVSITALRPEGPTTQQTQHIKNTLHPTWNQQLQMNGIQFFGFMVQVWDGEERGGDNDKEIGREELVEVLPGSHHHIHCISPSCSQKLHLSYEFRESQCSKHPCQNGGTCTEDSENYSCQCTAQYTGANCETRFHEGRLVLNALTAKNLPRDRYTGITNPYLKVEAFDRQGLSVENCTRALKDTRYPKWYQELDLGVRQWARFEVSVWDEEDSRRDHLLTRVHSYLLPESRGVSERRVKFRANRWKRGRVMFSYSFK